MRRIRQSLAASLASGILLGACGSLSAAEAITVNVTPAQSEQDIKHLIDQLGSKCFKEREQATQELSQLGMSALPSLKMAAKSPDAEVRRRAQKLVEKIEPPLVRSIELNPVHLLPNAKLFL